MAEGRTQVIALKKVKHLLDLVGDAAVAGQQRSIGVDACSLFMEVARTHVCHTVGRLLVAQRNQNELAVDFESRYAKNHLDAVVLQLVAPLDVVAFIKARLQLNDHGHLLAVLGCVDQGVHHRRILGHPVQVDADATHLGVDGRLAQQIHHMPKGLVRVIEQHIALFDLADDAGFALEVRMRNRRLRWKTKLLRTKVREAHEVALVVVTSPWNHLAGLHAGLDHQKVQEAFWDGFVIHKAHVLALLAAGDALGHLLHERLGDVVVDVQLRVAGDLEGVGLGLHGVKQGKQTLETEANHIIHKHDMVLAFRRGQLHKTRQRIGNLHKSVAHLARIVFEANGKVDHAVLQLRKLGPAREHDGHQTRAHLAAEVFGHKVLLLGAQFGVVQEVDALGGHVCFQGFVSLFELVLLTQDDVMDLVQDGVRIVHRVGIGALFEGGHATKRRHTHPEKLVEVVGKDAQETHAFDERIPVVLGLLQHAFVEREPADFPIDVGELHGQVNLN